jgi:putative ABC transport system substrate-binding protein
VIGRRRAVLAAAAFAAAPANRVSAQAPLRIGWLSVSPHPFIAVFRDRLRELGYVEGQTLVIEQRYAHGNAALLPGLVDELAKLGVSVLVTSGSGATDAALAAAKGVPVIFVTSDPMATNKISLARPGGVATGISTMSADIAPKKIGLMRDALPGLPRLALLNDDSSGGDRQTEELAAASRKLGLETQSFSSPDPNGFARVFAAIVQERWQGMIAVSSPLFTAHARAVAELTVKHRIPALFDTPAFVRAGALMSYGADLNAVFRRQAELVQRLARGAKVADIPVEQPSRFVFGFNQATARALGVSLSVPVMASVDELVE